MGSPWHSTENIQAGERIAEVLKVAVLDRSVSGLVDGGGCGRHSGIDAEAPYQEAETPIVVVRSRSQKTPNVAKGVMAKRHSKK
jgi:hypothetical protein